MPEKHFVECLCGKRIAVELEDAGTTRTCPSCLTTVGVPGFITQNELACDEDPPLTPLEKIRETLENAETPFDGVCHACDNDAAEYEVPITLDVPVKRPFKKDTVGVYPTALGVRHATTFPLFLCWQCHADFQSAQRNARLMNIAMTFSVFSLFSLVLYMVYFNPPAIPQTVMGALFALAMGIVSRHVQNSRHSKYSDSFVHEWINHIRGVPEAIAAESEYRLSVGEARPREPSTR